MNIKIVYVDISKPFCQYEKYLPLVSEERQVKINRFHFDKDKIVSLIAELLMRNETSQKLNIPFDQVTFGYGEYGKPYLINSSDYHFSISHSGNCIAFIGSDYPVGIDIEKIADENMDIAKQFFTANEYNFIENNEEPITAFYKIWTSKEAYVKLLGIGLSKDFQSFDVLDNRLSCRFVTKTLSEYVITVCCEKTIENINVKEIKTESLLI